MSQFAPIALFVYNRLWHTEQTVESLLANTEAQESDLFVFSDGAKNNAEQNKVTDVRNYINSIRGFKSVSIIQNEVNLGLANSIISGVTKVVEQKARIIVLEDDMVVSKYFLEYMNTALSMYELDDEVISIHGYCYPVPTELPETFFLKGADCWGWATWKRGWRLFEKDANNLLRQIMDKNLGNEFDYNSSMNYRKMLMKQIKGEIDSWAIRWYASAFLQEKLTLYPGVSLVNNIGTDSSGTHLRYTQHYKTAISDRPIQIMKIPCEESYYARKTFEEYFNSIHLSFLKRGLILLNQFLKDLF